MVDRKCTVAFILAMIVLVLVVLKVAHGQTKPDVKMIEPTVQEIGTPPSKPTEEKAPEVTYKFPVKGIERYMNKGQQKKLADHIAAGGKWLINDFEWGHGKLQHERFFEGTREVFVKLDRRISGGEADICLPPGSKKNPKAGHNHLGLFEVRYRAKKQWSDPGKCYMYWGLFYYGDHGNHAAHSNGIPYLGYPASHGCDRQLPSTAKTAYKWAGKDKIYILNICNKHFPG